MREKAVRKQIWIVGVGCGDRGMITRAAQMVIRRADLLIMPGGDAIPEAVLPQEDGSRRACADGPKEIREAVDAAEERRIAILVPGDPGDSNQLDELMRRLKELHPAIVPGISPMSCLSSKTGVAWQDAVRMDLRGGKANVVAALKKAGKLFIEGAESMNALLAELADAGYGDSVLFAGMHLGYVTEGVVRGTVEEMVKYPFPADTCAFLVRGTEAEGRSFGRRDEDFAAVNEEGLPSCVRASVLSRLALTGEECLYVVGDPDGRLAAECAAALDGGLVYAACPAKEEAERTLLNAKRQYIHNMTILQGQVPSVLMHLPQPDAAFFMDADAQTEPLTEILLSRNPMVRLVSVTDCIEECSRTAQFFEARGIETEVVQIVSVVFSGGRSHHRAGAAKPYYIISGNKRKEPYHEG